MGALWVEGMLLVTDRNWPEEPAVIVWGWDTGVVEAIGAVYWIFDRAFLFKLGALNCSKIFGRLLLRG